MRARTTTQLAYYDPTKDEAVEIDGCAADGVPSLLGVIVGLSSQ
jgi:hypothetical protein